MSPIFTPSATWYRGVDKPEADVLAMLLRRFGELDAEDLEWVRPRLSSQRLRDALGQCRDMWDLRRRVA